MFKRVLFVCTGNTCRSPQAEAIFNRIATDGLIAKSAGTHTIDGINADWNVIEVMKERNIDLNNHKSQLITEDLIIEADNIYCLTKSHYDYLINKFPKYKDKIATLADEDIMDREVTTREGYRDLLSKIEEAVTKIIEEIT